MPPPQERDVTLVEDEAPTRATPPGSMVSSQQTWKSTKGPPLSQLKPAPPASASTWARDTGKQDRRMRKRAESSPSPTPPHRPSCTAASASTSIYGLVPGGTRRASTSSTTFETHVGDGARTGGATWTSLDPVTSTTTTPARQHVDSDFPDPPFWVIYLVAAAITAGFLGAVLLYFINFPPKLGSRKAKIGKYKYAEVQRHDPDEAVIDTAVSTSAHTPTLLARRRRQNASLSMDTSTSLKGLGIAVHGTQTPVRFDSEQINQPSVSLRTLPPAVFSARSSLQATPQETPRESQRRPPDLEDGLLSPEARRRLNGEESPTESASNSSSSSRVGLLEKMGDGIEYAADKFAKMLHDQVRADPEDELLLPVRDSERERKPDLRKLC